MTRADNTASSSGLTSVAISNIEDGTDGELLTWDASGVATTVAVGTAGQVLVSNGAGAEPAFSNITGSSIIDTSSTEAFLVRKAGDTGDLFSIDTISSQVYLTGGVLKLTNGVSNWINYGSAGVGSPTFTTRSSGTKMVLYESVGVVSVDYAAGVEPFHLWHSVPENIPSFGFKWYGGTAEIMKLDGTGHLTLSSNFVTSGTITSNNILPNFSETSDLGSATKEWNNIYSQNAVTVSDRDKKKNILPETTGLDFLLELEPKTYEYVSNNNKSRGLIAQDVEILCKKYGIEGIVRCERKQETLTREVVVDGETITEEYQSYIEPKVCHNYGLVYTELLPIIINAIKELDSKKADK